MKKHYLLLALFIPVIACGPGNGNESNENTEAPAEEPSTAYTLTPFDASTAFEDAEITSMNFENGGFSFGIAGDSYELGVQTPDAPQKMCANSAEGQHIHLIVDDAPYAAKYTATFDYEIPDGDHYLLAFLSRSYHESIKTEKAHVAVKTRIASNSITELEDVTAPLLFYSRPKGNYVGDDARKVMLDFYLVNTDLGTEYLVKADINGEEHVLDKWQPYYIEGLPMGENTITLSLIDKDGQLVETPLNPISRTFTLVADPAENQ